MMPSSVSLVNLVFLPTARSVIIQIYLRYFFLSTPLIKAKVKKTKWNSDKTDSVKMVMVDQLLPKLENIVFHIMVVSYS